jgi:hypothetical protein
VEATVALSESLGSSSTAKEQEIHMKSTVKVAITIAATVKTTLIVFATVAFCMLGYGDGLFPSV